MTGDGTPPTGLDAAAPSEGKAPATPLPHADIPFDHAFGIAHVMTNLLAVVAGQFEDMQEQEPGSAAARQAATTGLVAAERAARLMRSMMARLDGYGFRPGRCDSAVLLRSLSPAGHDPSGSGLKVAGSEALPLMVDPVALADLLNNTLEALQPNVPGGSLELNCRPLAVPPPAMPAGSYAALEILGGHWQTPLWQQRALGDDWSDALLSFCRQAGGRAEILASAAGDVRITLILPIIDERPEPAPPSILDYKGIVLVVEDDETLRLHAERVIAALGYRVRSAPSGEDALLILREDNTVDVLFTDVVMPGGMSGGELAQQLGQSRPEVPIVFTSGHHADPVVAAILRGHGASMLPKPYRRNSLADMLDAAMRRRVQGKRAGRAPGPRTGVTATNPPRLSARFPTKAEPS